MDATSNNIVYRLYNRDGALLYVGSSSRGARRIREHAGFHTWWCEVANSEVEFFDDIGAARIAEGQQIRQLNPKYNTHRMGPMYKTTIEFPYDVYVRLKQYATADGRHMKAVIVEAVEALLAESG